MNVSKKRYGTFPSDSIVLLGTTERTGPLHSTQYKMKKGDSTVANLFDRDKTKKATHKPLIILREKDFTFNICDQVVPQLQLRLHRPHPHRLHLQKESNTHQV